MLCRILETIRVLYRSTVYNLGPRAFTNGIETFCQKPAQQLLKGSPCKQKDVAVFNHSLIGPHQYTQFKKYFVDVTDKQYEESTRSAMAFHLFNKLSATTSLPVNSKSLYARAAREFCPISFSTCKITF